jgi:uncharacterized membrane protein
LFKYWLWGGAFYALNEIQHKYKSRALAKVASIAETVISGGIIAFMYFAAITDTNPRRNYLPIVEYLSCYVIAASLVLRTALAAGSYFTRDVAKEDSK